MTSKTKLTLGAAFIVALIEAQGSSFAAATHYQHGLNIRDSVRTSNQTTALTAVPEHRATVDELLQHSDELLRATERDIEARDRQALQAAHKGDADGGNLL